MARTTAHIEQLAINTIRTLAMDAVQAANSGHPGTPMALAPVVYTLWSEFLRYDPDAPNWPARDRFVLSAGHASMLLYAVLHLAGVKQVDSSGRDTGESAVPLEHIRRFRQLDSRCPGHPEHVLTSGVETTTGPLGQGVGNSVGMAMAQRWLAAHFHRPGFEPFDYRVFALASDGDLMEGLSGEAASLAGHLKLSNLCWIYDNNQITIEGKTSLAFSEDVATRFAGYGWRVETVDDANDLDALRRAFRALIDPHDRPTLVIVSSHIAWGAPTKQDTHHAHGAPLGTEEVRLTKARYGWPEAAQFLVPDEVRAHFRQSLGDRSRRLRAAWEARWQDYRREHSALATQWEQMRSRQLPSEWDAQIPTFPADAKGEATRVTAGQVLNRIAAKVPWLIGGSADLAPSTMTLITDEAAGHFAAGHYGGRNIHFGVREHAMGAVLNGLALSHIRPYGATFLVFSDYMRPAIRLAAIMGLPVICVFTHDSIGVGEDGPTHQPVEHLAALRAIPGLITIRPADANEAAEALRTVMMLDRPAALILTRQKLPTLDRARFAPAAGLRRGAYVLADPPTGAPDVLLLASGSEVSLSVAAHEQLAGAGMRSRVVSFPSWELFDMQDEAYRHSVLPPNVDRRIAVEAAAEQGWSKYLGPRGRFIGMTDFGASAPGEVLFKHFDITVDRIVAEAKAALAR